MILPGLGSSCGLLLPNPLGLLLPNPLFLIKLFLGLGRCLRRGCHRHRGLLSSRRHGRLCFRSRRRRHGRLLGCGRHGGLGDLQRCGLVVLRLLLRRCLLRCFGVLVCPDQLLLLLLLLCPHLLQLLSFAVARCEFLHPRGGRLLRGLFALLCPPCISRCSADQQR